MSTNLVGATVNAGGTRLAQARMVGSAVLNLADASKDPRTLVPNGSTFITVKAAINMGILRRDAGVLIELNPAQPYTRAG